MLEYNASVLLPDEFSTMLPAWDTAFMAFLTAVYEGDRYDQERRHLKEDIKILSPTLNILSATTPSNLVKFMPEGAWDQGFASRIIMVYNGDRTLLDIFGEDSDTIDVEYNDLLYDLNIIGSLYGQIEITEPAAGAFRAWRDAGLAPEPHHPKLTHYNTRRTAHVLRLAMVISVSKGNGMKLTVEDFEEAKGLLVETEMAMPDVFLAGKAGAQTDALDELRHMVEKMAIMQKPCTQSKVIHFLRERIPSTHVLKTLEISIAEGSIKEMLDAKTGTRTYLPGPRPKTFD